MTYRQYYWKKVKENIHITWVLFWNGVALNKGHHSTWRK